MFIFKTNGIIIVQLKMEAKSHNETYKILQEISNALQSTNENSRNISLCSYVYIKKREKMTAKPSANNRKKITSSPHH